MYICNFALVTLIASIVDNSLSVRNNAYYSFIKHNPNGIHRNSILTANNHCKLWPCISNACDKIIENKKYSIFLFTAMIAGIFAPKSLWNLLSFKAEISDNTATGQLNTYRCTKCNYTIYPAKNRDSKFVGQVISDIIRNLHVQAAIRHLAPLQLSESINLYHYGKYIHIIKISLT